MLKRRQTFEWGVPLDIGISDRVLNALQLDGANAEHRREVHAIKRVLVWRRNSRTTFLFVFSVFDCVVVVVIVSVDVVVFTVLQICLLTVGVWQVVLEQRG